MATTTSRSAGAPLASAQDRLFFHMALVCAAVAFVGFAPTYWAPMLSGRLAVHPVFHVHAVLFFGWSLVFVIQTWLAASRRYSSHRAMGLLTISVATSMVIAGVLIAINRMHAAAAMGQLEAGLAFSIVPLGAIVFFAVFFAAAVANVRRTEWHKRLMLVAAISILDAPIARWFMMALAPDAPPGPPPVAVDLGPSLVALLLLAVAMIADWRKRGHVHPAYWIGGATYLAWKLIQMPLSATTGWQSTAGWIMALGG
jgi:hypothetical protein